MSASSLHYGGDLTIYLGFPSCWGSQGSLADVALNHVRGMTVNELLIAAVRATYTKEVGRGFGDKALPVCAHSLSLTPNGQFSQTHPFFLNGKPAILTFQLERLFLRSFGELLLKRPSLPTITMFLSLMTTSP